MAPPESPPQRDNFWEMWAEKLINSGMDENYIRQEIENMRRLESDKNLETWWHQGKEDLRELMEQIFSEIIVYRSNTETPYQN